MKVQVFGLGMMLGSRPCHKHGFIGGYLDDQDRRVDLDDLFGLKRFDVEPVRRAEAILESCLGKMPRRDRTLTDDTDQPRHIV